MESLPVDVLAEITHHLDWGDRVALFRTAKLFHSVVSVQRVFWSRISLIQEHCSCYRCLRPEKDCLSMVAIPESDTMVAMSPLNLSPQPAGFETAPQRLN